MDTYEYKKHPVRTLLRSAACLWKNESVILLVSANGESFYLPFLYYLNKIFRKKIYRRGIGGALVSDVKKHPKWIKYLNSFEVNWVQGKQQTRDLKRMGVLNAEEIGNFRNDRLKYPKDMENFHKTPYPFVTFGRVMKEKGAGLAMEAVAQVNRKKGFQAAVLDIYGPIEADFENEFRNLLKQCGSFVQYKGILPAEQSTRVLSCYYMHLFPSTWRGEGVAGSLADALSAGVPSISSDWNLNDTVIKDGYSGFCYDYRKPELLKEKILYAIEHPGEINAMRQNCLSAARRFSPDAVMGTVVSRMGITRKQEMKRSSMKISIVLCTYNGQTYITEQLDSIRKQSRDPDEVLIFDDCSDDATVSVIRRYIRRWDLDWKVTVNEQNKGWQKNFTDAFFHASGDIIFCADQDDIWYENKLEVMSAIFEENQKVMLLASKVRMADAKRKEIKQIFGQPQKCTHTSKLQKVRLGYDCYRPREPGCAIAFRSTMLKMYQKYWTDGYPHDQMLWNIAAVMDGAYEMDCILLDYRRTDQSVFVSISKQRSVQKRLMKIRELSKSMELIERMMVCECADNKEQLLVLKDLKRWISIRKEMVENSRLYLFLPLLAFTGCYESRLLYFVDMADAVHIVILKLQTAFLKGKKNGQVKKR